MDLLKSSYNKKEVQLKYEVYEASAVKEYWVVHPDERTLLIYTLEAGKYRSSRLFTLGDQVRSQTLAGFVLELDEVFGDL